MDDTTNNFWQVFRDWQATPVEYKPPIQRLYYDDNGMPLFYVDQDLPGNYIDLDGASYVVADMQIRVVDGKIVKITQPVYIKKLVPDSESGTCCHPDNIGIVVDDTEPCPKWKLKTYEKN